MIFEYLFFYYFYIQAIPLRLIVQARGLAFLTIVKGGFIFAPSLGMYV